MINVVIADDHAIVRQGIRLNLSTHEEITIIGEASDGKEAVDMVAKLSPELLIVDISMPELSGIEVTRIISEDYSSTKVLILSTHNDEEYILESFEAGASGYLPKDSPLDQIILAIETINSEKIFYTEAVAKTLALATIKQKSPGKSLKSLLTLREKEVLKLIVEGVINKEIADKLFVSVRTVDAHRRNIMSKLDVSNSAELVRVTLEKRLV